MYTKIENNQVTQTSLPTSGILSDGRSVSNYNLLPESVLLAEGWLPLVESKPVYDPATQELQLTEYTTEKDKVTANYVVVDIVPEPDPDAELATAIQAATTIAQLKDALLGKNGIARVKGRQK